MTPSEFTRGAPFQVTGSGFVPGSTTVFALDGWVAPVGHGGSIIGGATADAAGSVAATLRIPDDAPLGTTTIRAACSDGSFATATMTILAGSTEQVTTTTVTTSSRPTGSAGGTTELPRTGDDAGSLLLVAGLSTLAGTAVTLATRRRDQGAQVRR